MMMQHRHVEPVVIGRDRHIAEVVDLIKNANDGQGSFIVIEGGPGAGKTTLIQAFDGHCKQDAALADARFLIGTCSQGTRYLDPYQPFVDILSGLLNKERGGRDVLQRLRSIVTATGPDLVPMIPVVGAPLIAGVMPVSIMTGLGLGIGDDRRSATSVAISAQIETVFLEAAIEFAPLILVIDDAQWIDESSRHVLKQLVRDIDRKRIVVILALRPEEAAEHRPLTEMRPDIRRSPTVEIALADLDADAMLERRLRMLDDADRELLRLASVQGERFRPSLLAQMIGTDEPAVLGRIQHLIDEYGLISVGPGDVWSSDQPEVYQFVPTMLRDVLYNQIHTHHRPPLHAAIATHLESIAARLATPPRKLLLEIARQAEAGRDPALAAKSYVFAAHTSFRDGAGTETAEICRRAVQNAQLILAGTDQHDRLYAEAIALSLAAKELDWGTRTEAISGEDPHSLVAAAEAAADRVRDPLVAAQLKYLAGKILLNIDSRTDAVAKFEEALRDAHTADDPLTEFLVLTQLGHHSAGGNVRSALHILHRALDVFQRRLQPIRTNLAIAPADLDRQYHHLLQVIGVAEFDLGNFDQAIRLLEASRSGVAASTLQRELERVLNFLGQAYTASGQYEQAEQALTDAIDLEIASGMSGTSYPWRVYNRGQLGKLYIEWERFEDAASILATAWDETRRLRTASLTPLVANF